jgi:hypothetical protein
MLALLAGMGALLVACGDKHAWYRIDDYPGFTLAPVLKEETSIEDPSKGAPERMIKLNEQLQVQCNYCHVDGDPRTCFLTPEGTVSRLMIDLADRFKVECAHCHAESPTKLTLAGRFSLRDLRDPARRWTCAKCHDAGFKLKRM